MIRRIPGLVPISFAALGFAAISLAPAARADDAPGMPAPGMPAPATPAPTGPAPSGGRFFDTYDANQDGKVTKEEFSGDADIFELLDKNKDGSVCLDELGLPADYKPRPLPKEPENDEGSMKGGNLAKRAEEMKKRFIQLKAMDKDGDGRVSKDEYNGKLPFDYMDKNKDGFIDEKDSKGGGGGEMPGGGMPMSPEEMANRFKEADKNGDGKVSKEEFPGAAERFARLDKDADGFVTIEEFQAAMKDMPQGEGKGGRRMLMQFDKNGDGKIARDEFPGGDEKFKELDKNGDGFIAEDELPRGGKDGNKGKKPADGEKPTTPTTPGMPAPSDGPMPGSMPGPAPTGGMGGLFVALDKDRDGRLSRAEFPGTDEEWRRLDKDQNGWITPEEASSK